MGPLRESIEVIARQTPGAEFETLAMRSTDYVPAAGGESSPAAETCEVVIVGTAMLILDALVDLADDVAGAELAHASLRSPREKGLANVSKTVPFNEYLGS